MSVSQDPVPAPPATVDPTTTTTTTTTATTTATKDSVVEPKTADAEPAAAVTAPKLSQDTSAPSSNDPTGEFSGDLDTNNELPSQTTLKKLEETIILDEHNKSRPFKSVYTGPNVARRVLVIFVRHFFCGNCQEYLRTLSENISPEALLSLPVPTSIAVIGCGATSLIADYRERTGCPFPIYADPTKKLYNELGMTRTLDMGARPEYQRANNMTLILKSFWQNLKQVPVGNALQGGDIKQVGGEFLFEPISSLMQSPAIPSPVNESAASADESRESYFEEEKRVTWCHRMKNTRDHAEIPELREVLGFEDDGKPGKNQKRWSMALGSRKGTGLSAMGRKSSSERALSKESSPVREPVPAVTAVAA